MKKDKQKPISKLDRRTVKKDITIRLINELKEITDHLGTGSKELTKDIEKGSKKLAKKIIKDFKFIKPAALENYSAKQVTTNLVKPKIISKPAIKNEAVKQVGSKVGTKT